jgi:DNA-binding MarR family transcriptional regulator
MTPSAPALDLEIFADLRAALRGRTIEDLAEIFGQTVADVTAAADRLLATGRIVRRGKKLYQA